VDPVHNVKHPNRTVKSHFIDSLFTHHSHTHTHSHTHSQTHRCVHIHPFSYVHPHVLIYASSSMHPDQSPPACSISTRWVLFLAKCIPVSNRGSTFERLVDVGRLCTQCLLVPLVNYLLLCRHIVPCVYVLCQVCNRNLSNTSIVCQRMTC
jgi:hypothetical protein